jgi:hypothetical protein
MEHTATPTLFCCTTCTSCAPSPVRSWALCFALCLPASAVQGTRLTPASPPASGSWTPQCTAAAGRQHEQCDFRYVPALLLSASTYSAPISSNQANSSVLQSKQSHLLPPILRQRCSPLTARTAAIHCYTARPYNPPAAVCQSIQHTPLFNKPTAGRQQKMLHCKATSLTCCLQSCGGTDTF